MSSESSPSDRPSDSQKSGPGKEPSSPEPPQVSADENLKQAYSRWLLSFLEPRSLFRRASYKFLAIFILSPFLLFKFIVVPLMVSKAVTTYAEGKGVELEIGSWTSNVLNLSATAHDLTVFTSRGTAQPPVLQVEAVLIDLSLWSGLFGDSWVRSVQVQAPKLLLERSLSGSWNWADVADLDIGSIPPSPGSPGTGPAAASRTDGSQTGLPWDFYLRRLNVEEMSLQWVENLPGSSSGGVLQEVKASLHLDEVSLQASNLAGPVDPRENPTRLTLEGRTGGGKISFNGDVNLFHWSSLEAQDSPGARDGELLWSPTAEATFYLENLGAQAFSRLTPQAALIPKEGRLYGEIRFRVVEAKMSCWADLRLQDVTFAVNRSSPVVKGREAQLENELAGYRVSGPKQFDCSGFVGTDDFRPVQAFLTNVTRQGVDQAPRTVRAVAEVEHSRYSPESVDPALQSDVDRIVRSIDSEARVWLNLRSAATAAHQSLRRSSNKGFLGRAKRKLGIGGG